MAGVLDTIRGGFRGTDDQHRVTTLELLFDLVFVFAITNVTALVAHDVTGTTVLEGLIVLALIWFGWCAYAWLGNQAKADEGLLRIAVMVAMAGMFFVAIAIPHAFAHDGNAAGVLVAAYAVVRLTHIVVYLITTGDDRQQRSVLLAMLGVASLMLALLTVGAVVGGDAQRWWWLGGVVVDQLGVYFVRSTRWQLNSASHFAERFGLIVIIAIGESVVAIGTASSSASIGLSDAVALLCGLVVAVVLWRLYFDVAAPAADEVLLESQGVERIRLGRDAYTYIHFPMVVGIEFVALGLEILIADDGQLRAGRAALLGGVACYLLGHLLFRRRNGGPANVPAIVATVVFVLAIPLVRTVRPLPILIGAAVALLALATVEARVAEADPTI